jgi:hypothetical protein
MGKEVSSELLPLEEQSLGEVNPQVRRDHIAFEKWRAETERNILPGEYILFANERYYGRSMNEIELLDLAHQVAPCCYLHWEFPGTKEEEERYFRIGACLWNRFSCWNVQLNVSDVYYAQSCLELKNLQ